MTEPAIHPIPAAERLPEPEDCDEEGRCWVGTWSEIDGERVPDWELASPACFAWKGLAHITCWLPYHALPVPLPRIG